MCIGKVYRNTALKAITVSLQEFLFPLQSQSLPPEATASTSFKYILSLLSFTHSGRFVRLQSLFFPINGCTLAPSVLFQRLLHNPWNCLQCCGLKHVALPGDCVNNVINISKVLLTSRKWLSLHENHMNCLSPGLATEALSQHVPLLGVTEPTAEGAEGGASPLVSNRGARSNAQSMWKLPTWMQMDEYCTHLEILEKWRQCKSQVSKT